MSEESGLMNTFQIELPATGPRKYRGRTVFEGSYNGRPAILSTHQRNPIVGPLDYDVEVWGCQVIWCLDGATTLTDTSAYRHGDPSTPTCEMHAELLGGQRMDQPTPDEDKANGTVSAANTPDPEATNTFNEAPSVLARDVENEDVEAPEGAGEKQFRDTPFASTSDEDAPNLGHGDSDTPLFESIPGHQSAAGVDSDEASE